MNEEYEALAQRYLTLTDLFPGRFRSIDDLRRSPWIVDKGDLRRLYPFGLCLVDPADIYSYHESFGTTGTPTAGFYSRADFDRAVAQIADSPISFRRGDRALIRFPYAISVPAHLFHRAVQSLGGGVIACSSRTPVSPYPRVVRMAADLGATILCSMPTEAITLGFYARRMGLEPRRDFPRLRAIACAGEPLPEAMRRYLMELWGVEVYNFYGSTETGNIACACALGRLHPAWGDFCLETLERPDGLRELIVSTLGKEALPLFKYRIEDIVELEPGPCPCGRSGATLSVLGRAGDHYRIADRLAWFGDIKTRIFDFLRTGLDDTARPFWRTFCDGKKLLVQVEGLRAAEALRTTLEDGLKVPVQAEGVQEGAVFDLVSLDKIEEVGKPRYCLPGLPHGVEAAVPGRW